MNVLSVKEMENHVDNADFAGVGERVSSNVYVYGHRLWISGCLCKLQSISKSLSARRLLPVSPQFQ